MPFKQANTWRERGLQIQEIKDKCNSIIENLNLNESDVRIQGMIHVRGLGNTLAAIPIKLQQNAENPNNISAILSLLGLASIDDLRTILEDFNANSKIGFITSVQFVLENCIVRIIEAIPGVDPKFSFSQNADIIIEQSEIPQAAHKLDLMLLPAWIRNTLHANGIHNRSNRTFVVDGESYIFEKGQRIACGKWSHLFHAIFHSLAIYEEIFTSDRIRAIERIQSI